MATPTDSDGEIKCEETCFHGYPVNISEVTKRICHTCALKKDHFHLPGHKKWLCERHKEVAKVFCITHAEVCCKSCALIFHQSPCHVRNISEVVEEKRNLLEAKLPLREKSAGIMKECLQKMSENVLAFEKSFQEMENEVNQHFDEAFQKEDKWEKEAVISIDREYEAKIKKLQENKECILRRSREEAELRRKPLQENRRNLLDDIHRCKAIVEAGIKKLQHKMEELQIVMQDLKLKIGRVLHAERETVLKSVGVCEEIDQTLGKVVKMNEVLHVTNRITNSISLLRKTRNGKIYHRIDSQLHGSWELVDEFRIPSNMKDLRILGCAFNDRAFFQDVKTGKGYIFDSKRELVEVLHYDGKGLVNYCIPLDEEFLLCGRTQAGCFKRTLSGCICLYDRQWQLKKDIEIPRNTSGTFSCVSVDVDCNGMVVASEAKQSHIYVINPANGLIVQTILLRDVKCKRCLCMPSGDLVVSTGEGEFIILDRAGTQKRIIRDNDWRLASDFSLDPLLDKMYVVYWDKNQESYAVDEVSIYGKKVKQIVTFPQASWSETTSKIRTYPVLITHAGKLIACNEDNILIFKRTVCFSDSVLHF